MDPANKKSGLDGLGQDTRDGEREGSRSDAKWSEIKRGGRRGRGGEEEEEESGGGEGHPPPWQRKSADLCSSKQPLSLFLLFLPSGQHAVSKSPTLIPFLFLCTSLLLRLMRNLSTQRGGDKKPSLLPWEPLEGGTFHLQWRRREQRCSGETEEGEVRRREDTFCIPRSKVGRSVGRWRERGGIPLTALPYVRTLFRGMKRREKIWTSHPSLEGGNGS